jgi:dual specificity phosphatase 12
MRFLAEKQITAVLSVCTDFVPAEDRTLGLWHLRLAVPEEGSDLLVELPRAVAFITQARAAGRTVLVHSTRGQSRAPAVIAAYRECTLDARAGRRWAHVRRQ